MNFVLAQDKNKVTHDENVSKNIMSLDLLDKLRKDHSLQDRFFPLSFKLDDGLTPSLYIKRFKVTGFIKYFLSIDIIYENASDKPDTIREEIMILKKG
mmetsp:Transcript_34069/g.30838  ORF Transcript_34069/g.30838 Transcript_34069/m.30838 type:complete len:98 (-) Transcript_34069:939-1232(-)